MAGERMIVDMPGPDPIRGRLYPDRIKRRRAAALKGWRTRRDMERARSKDDDVNIHDETATAKVEAALLKLGPIDDLDEQAQLDLLIGAIADLEAAYEALSGRKWKWADRAG